MVCQENTAIFPILLNLCERPNKINITSLTKTCIYKKGLDFFFFLNIIQNQIVKISFQYFNTRKQIFVLIITRRQFTRIKNKTLSVLAYSCLQFIRSVGE